MRLLVALALSLMPLVACAASSEAQTAEALRGPISARYPEISWVDAPTLARWMQGDAPIVLLDARAEDEYRVSHLAGARRVDPDAPRVERLRLPDGARVVVYCSVGWRSGAVADALRRAGHRAYNLEGGIFAWANAGREVVREARPVSEVHPYDAVWGRMLRRSLHAYSPG